MKRTTTIGKMYAVTSAAGCTVTTPDGLPICTVEAGTQGYFTAPTSTVEVDDDAALLTLTFKRAASVLRLLGGGVVEKWDKYANCTTVAEMRAINADYKNDVNASGEWAWKLPLLKSAQSLLENASAIKKLKVELPAAINISSFALSSSVEKAKISAPLATGVDNVMKQCGLLSELEIEAPRATISWYFTQNCSSLKKVKGNLQSVQKGDYSFSGCKQLREFFLLLPKLDSASGMFDKAQLDKASALRVLGSIPAKTDGVKHSLTLGIHVDFQADEEVTQAILEAESKGWTLSVQWNGTAGEYAQAASTFALRRRMPVFARLGEPMADGTLTLDWGHYVTDPSGYTEFASLEEAKEHFNIVD